MFVLIGLEHAQVARVFSTNQRAQPIFVNKDYFDSRSKTAPMRLSEFRLVFEATQNPTHCFSFLPDCRKDLIY